MGGGDAAPRARRPGGHELSAAGGGSKAASRWLPPLELAADLATTVLVAFGFARLFQIARDGKLWTDECFHAAMAEWIAERGALPRVIPELYGGFYGFHPPLFHALGAAWVSLFGNDAIRYLNLFVTALLLLWVALDRGAGDRTARRWAILLCMSCGWIQLFAVRLYVEQLTALLAVGSALLALRVWRAPARLSMLALGVTVGLGLLTKHSSVALVAMILGLAAAAFARRERAAAVAFAQAAGVGLLVAAPYLIRNWVLYGSPIYPAFAPDRDPLLFELNRRVFTPEPLALYRETMARAGWPIGVAVLGAIGLSAWRRQMSLELGLIAASVAFVLLGPLTPLLDVRHMVPVIAMVAVLSAILVARHLASWPAVRALAGVALLAAAATTAPPPPTDSGRNDESTPLLQALEETGRRVPVGETVLSLWTYDTWYYARRPATWPIPWGQSDRPVEMFMTSNCDSVLLAFRRHRLRYALVPRVTGGPAFDGVNYPAPFVECMQSMLVDGRMELLWMSPFIALVHVPAADSLPKTPSP